MNVAVISVGKVVVQPERCACLVLILALAIIQPVVMTGMIVMAIMRIVLIVVVLLILVVVQNGLLAVVPLGIHVREHD